MKKLSLCRIIALFSCATFVSPAYATTKEIIILHTNDIESVYEPLQANWREDMEQIGGIPHLATLIRQQRAMVPTSFLVDAGDIYTGALSKKSEGKLPFDLYSAMGYDALAIGNHEFEYGWKSLVETMPRARFPVLNANIVYSKSGSLFARPYTILQRNGVRIGVIGVMGVDAFYNTMATFHRTGLTIKDPIQTAQYWADKIRDDVNMIVVLTHQNKTAPMQTNKEADQSVQRGFDEDYAMAGELVGVDAIFGGHSDNGLPEPVVHPQTGTVIGLTFGQGMHLGYTKFKVDTDIHNVSFIEGYLIPVDSNKLSADPETTQLIEHYRQQYPALNEVVATISSAAMRSYNKESSLGNLLTDYMRAGIGSDIAFLNSGAIRADLNPGAVTLEHLINVYPFTGKLTEIALTGKQVKQLIEYSLTLPYGIGQVSGLTLEYNSSEPPMQRLISIQHNGKALVDTQTYTVCTSAFVVNGGDGYSIFTQGKLVSDEHKLADILYDQFKAAKTIAPPQLGRQIDRSE